MKLGRKIVERGQAEIFEVVCDGDQAPGDMLMWKVFKKGFWLQDSEYQKQWSKMIKKSYGLCKNPWRWALFCTCIIMGGILLLEGRFGLETKKKKELGRFAQAR